MIAPLSRFTAPLTFALAGMTHVVAWMLFAVVAGGCASAPAAPVGTVVESPASPIPLRAGYWVSPELRDARFTREGLGDVAFGDIMARGLAELAHSSFRWSAQFPSRDATLASPLVDVVVAPTMGALTMEPDPEGVGPKEIATVRMQWRVTDKTGRELWSNVVVTQLRDVCVVQRCRKQFAERAVREHFEAAGAMMRSLPWWERAR